VDAKHLDNLFEKHSQINDCVGLINQGKKRICLKGLIGSSKSLFIASILNKIGNSHLIIVPDKENAAYFQNDLEILLNTKVVFFPSSYKRSIIYGQEDSSNLLLRSETLNALANNDEIVIVSYPEAIAEKVIQKEALLKSTLTLQVGEQVSIEFIQEVMQEYHFQYTDFVYEPGQYSIRGSIIDIFSFASDLPFRIDSQLDHSISKANSLKISLQKYLLFQK